MSLIKNLLTVVVLQKLTNNNAKLDWLENPPLYLRAAFMEAVECIDHINSWKWWKKNSPDFHNAAMEMVDIFHFIISDELVTFGGDSEKVANLLLAQFSMPLDIEKIESLSAAQITDMLDDLLIDFRNRTTNYKRFLTIVVATGLSVEKLLLWYTGKGALNNIRQANGYKQGTYLKAWFGKEDNDTLIEVLDLMNAQSEPDLYKAIYTQLESKYAEALAFEAAKQN
jgi:hypothetical protein